MKTLIVYCSRTGNNEKLAQIMQQKFSAEIEAIISKVSFKGPIGYLRGGKMGMQKKACAIEPVNFNPKDFELTIVLSPIWGGLMAPPVRAYLEENRDKFNNVAFVSISGGGGESNFNRKAVPDFEAQIGKNPLFTLLLTEKEFKANTYSQKLEELVK